MQILSRIFSIITSILRLLFVMIIAFFSSLNKIFFDNMEIISMSLVMRPQPHARDTLGFIDNLRYNNRELVNGIPIPKSDAFDDSDPFIPDDLMIEEQEELAFDDVEDVPLDGDSQGIATEEPPEDDQCEPDDEEDDQNG